MSRFETQSAFLAKLQNETIMAVIHLFREVLLATENRQFLPSKRPFARETENTLKSGPDSLLVFQQLRIKSAPWKKAYSNNNANLKG